MRKGILLLIFAVLMVGCAREVEVYESQRPKTADMQDLNLYERKQQRIDSTEKEETEEATEEVTEALETEAIAETTEAPESEETEAAERYDDAGYPMDVTLLPGLNMRDGPGTEYQVIFPLTEGDEITVIGQVNGEDGPWYRVEYLDTNGYIDAATLASASDIEE